MKLGLVTLKFKTLHLESVTVKASLIWGLLLIWHNKYVNSLLNVCEIKPDEWMRLRDLRLRALEESALNLAGSIEEERNFSEEHWRSLFTKLTWVVATINDKDVGLISVENLKGDFGATCWLGGLWADPQYRGQGIARAIFNYLEEVAREKNWLVQGLGVMENNLEAIRAFEKFGFVRRGEPQESRRKPGRFYYRMIKEL